MIIEKYFIIYWNSDVVYWGYNFFFLWIIKYSVNTIYFGGMLYFVRSTYLYRKNINIYKILII